MHDQLPQHDPRHPVDGSRAVGRTAPTLWPAIAAGLAALLGMGSCALSVVPLTGFVNAPWLAPVIGIVAAGGVFRALLPLRSASGTAEGERAELRLAVAAAWLTTVATSLIVASQVNGAFRKPEAELDVYIVAFIIGTLIGGIFARITHVIGRRYFRRRRAMEEAGT